MSDIGGKMSEIGENESVRAIITPHFPLSRWGK